MSTLDATDQPAPAWRRLVQFAGLAAPVVVLVVLGWQHRWTSDDGFINLRVVSELRHGHGLVYNAGERVEAGTSPLWVLLLAAVDLITPLRLEWISVMSGLVLSAVGVAGAIRAALYLSPRRDRIAIPLGMAIYVAIPPAWDYTTSGLEHGLTVCWLGVSALLLARELRAERDTHGDHVPVLATLWVSLGPLVRPDLALYWIALTIAIVVAHARGRAGVARIVGIALVAPLAYEVFRAAYFATLVPNTAIAKNAGGSRWLQGWYYLSDFAGPYWLAVPIVALVTIYWLRARHSRQLRVITLAFVVPAVIHIVYVTRVGGDFMHARLLLVDLFALGLPGAVVPLERRYAIPTVAGTAWVIVAFVALRPHPYEVTQPWGPHGITLERQQYVSATHHQHPVTLGDFGYGASYRSGLRKGELYVLGQPVDDRDGPLRVAGRLRDRPVLIAFDAGSQAYAAGTDAYVIDARGLANPIVARFVVTHHGRPGHEKYLSPAWLDAAYLASNDVPDGLVKLFAVDPATGAIDPGRQVGLGDQITRARAMMRCGALAELLDDISEPITPARALSNIVHAWRNTTMTLVPTPTEAVDCAGSARP